ncbi:MAG: response regulator [Candidatus Bruticola sp.]
MVTHEEQFRRRLLATFQVEAEDYIKGILSGLSAMEIALDSDPLKTAPLIEPIFRQFHSLKGASQAIGCDSVGQICQSAENILSTWKKIPAKANKAELSSMIEAALSAASELKIDLATSAEASLDTTSTVLPNSTPNKIYRSAPLPSNVQEKQPLSNNSAAELDLQKKAIPGSKTRDLSSNSIKPKSETVRISSSKLDLLLRRGEQLVLARLNSKQRWSEAQNLLNNITLANRLLQDIADKSEENPFICNLSNDLRSIVTSMQRHTRNLGADYHELNNQLQSLLNEVKGARLAPVRPLLEELEIAARRIARQLSKKVRITTIGGDLELDRSIMESLKIPLIHLVRNALDHGLESTEERQALHKNLEGCLSIKVISRGSGLMEFVIADDGRGIQTCEVIEAAKRQGIISDDSEADSLDLIFTSGISTSSKVTELSGRGLGMAIVREKIEALKGTIRVKTKIGEGTSFILSVPTSLATFEGLLVKEQGRFLVFPLSGVEAVAQIKPEEIFTLESCPMINFRGRALPIINLDQILKLPRINQTQSRTGCSTVIAAAGGHHLALTVDEIIGVQEVLARDLGPQLKKVRFITGTCMVGYHQVVPVLNVADLLTNVRGSIRSIPQTEAHTSPLILVTDDSITTRTLIRGLLEAAGFRVRVAADGSQAWELMQNEKFDMLISDVDMPGITGFDLVIKVRSNSRLSKTPIILITGQERIEDRQRGLKLGANAYIGKSSFDKGLLLEAVTRFLGEVKVSR